MKDIRCYDTSVCIIPLDQSPVIVLQHLEQESINDILQCKQQCPQILINATTEAKAISNEL